MNSVPATEKEWFGQPRGLSTLFMTEMWERFTYYGMRAILILYMVAAVDEGGLGLDDKTGTSVYGLYISATYLLSLLGGWIADRYAGAQKTIWWGGILIMVGNGLLALGNQPLFFTGLFIIVCGVGLLKPNISAAVAQIYPEGGSRRDAGFSIFYMGINTGALLGSLLVPEVAGRFGWQAGFALPAFGMLLGLIQFQLTKKHLGEAGLRPAPRPAQTAGSLGWRPAALYIVLLIMAWVAARWLYGPFDFTPVLISRYATLFMIAVALGYFLQLLVFQGLGRDEQKRVLVMIVLFAGCAMFWAGFEQAGASLNLFADRYTDRDVFGWDMDAGTLQAANPLFIIIFAPIFAAIWVNLGKRNLDPSSPFKFGLGLVLMGVGFYVMYLASQYVVAGEKVLPTWLLLTYLFHTFGELCLSPVGLSSFSKLAPARFVGQALGVWFLATAIGNNLAGQLAGEFDASNLSTMPGRFLYLFWWGALSGAVLLFLTPALRKFVGKAK
jgi:POT family proton-dependent oligopeptide transporter